MSKERIDDIKEAYEMNKYDENYGLGMKDIEWLIEQAELMQRFAKKNGELNVFLNEYSEPKHLGKNGIDVAMAIIENQTEHVRELENHITKMAVSRYKDSEELDEVNKQSKRYREVIDKLNNPPLQHEYTAEAYAHYVVSILKALEGEK